MIRYLEFAIASNFSFLRGASHPEELMLQASHLGLAGLGLADRNSVAGVVRAHLIKREQKLGLAYHPGTRLVFADGTPDILAYPRDRAGWASLCRLLTTGNLRAQKGDCILFVEDLIEHVDGLELVVMEHSTRDDDIAARTASPQPLAGTAGDAASSGGSPQLARSPPPSPHTATRRDHRKPAPEDGDEPAKPRLRLIHSKREGFLSRLREAAPRRVRLAAAMHYRGNDRARLAARAALAQTADVPLIAVNDVLYHHPDRRELQDVLTCIREHLTIDKAGRRLAANAERHLKPAAEMARLFRDMPDAIAQTQALDAALTFSLDELKYDYPDESIAGFATPQDALIHLTLTGARQRYPDGIPHDVQASLAHEFALIAQRQYAPYFLTVHDIVRYARSQGILCQGRGSAANSTVCYCLGITSIDPVRGGLLFERFISTERREPPDIDVDFEHERREEVIQYLYRRYGRDRAGIAATVISYRGRSAIREIGKVFGLSEDTIGALSSSIWGMGGGAARVCEFKRAGIDINSPRIVKLRALVEAIQSFPRHLSQHVGGFVITRSRLDEVMPIMNGAMEKRTHVEWDKDDLDALGILKVDVLGLGMLTCIRKAFELCEKHYNLSFRLPLPGTGEDRDALGGFDLATVPPERPAVYRMLCRADSIGVFQVESRAQMSMLPRLQPKEFYDLVIEVAIVRPGPIQGDMVHPYLRRRQKREPVVYPSKELEAVLGKTLGVPLFQEQAMKIAIVAGGFTPGEADKLRRAMATFKRTGTIGTFRDKMVNGMLARNYPRDFAERCFSQIEGFGEYGFPESHAASFALLVYASAWLKCRYPDAFAAALLNAQPMGFYAPAQIVRDVREHGVEVRPIDVNHSDWDAVLEPGPRAAGRLHKLHDEMAQDIRATHAIRLGMREIKGVSEDDAKRVMAARTSPLRLAEEVGVQSVPRGGLQRTQSEPASPSLPSPASGGGKNGSTASGGEKNGNLASGKGNYVIAASEMSGHPYTSVRDVWLRTRLPQRVLERLADADAFGSLGLTRRQALWAVKALGRVGDTDDDLPLFAARLHPPSGEIDTHAASSPLLFAAEIGTRSVIGVRPQLAPSEPQAPSLLSASGRKNEKRSNTDRSGAEQENTNNRGNNSQSDRGKNSPDGTGRESVTVSGFAEPAVHLPPMSLGEEVVNDYRFLHLSLRAHPAQFLRADLAGLGVIRNEDLRSHRSGERIKVSGLVTIRQRPGSAAGVVFMTIEDETAVANIIVWPDTFERFRPIILGARYVAIRGRLQHESGVIHVIADTLDDLTVLLARLAEGPAIESLARCDEVRRPVDENRDKRGAPGRRSRLEALLADMPELASDLDVPARGTAHAPTRHGRG